MFEEHEGTTMSAAFSEAGIDCDEVRLNAAIDASKNASELWLMLSRDKTLAIAGMERLWAERHGARQPERPLTEMQVARRVADLITEQSLSRPAAAPRPAKTYEQRAAATAAKAQAGVALARELETKVIERELQTLQLRDGSVLGNCHWYELKRIVDTADRDVASASRDANICRALLRFTKPAKDSMLVKDVISPDQFDAILKDVT